MLRFKNAPQRVRGSGRCFLWRNNLDLASTTRKCWIPGHTDWRKSRGDPLAKGKLAVKSSSKPSRHVPQPSREDDLKTGSLAPQPAASRSIAESIGNQVRNLRR